MTKLKAILFDLDGTLRDTQEVVYGAVLHALKVHGAGELTKEDIGPYMHHHTAVYQKFLSHIDLEVFEKTYRGKLRERWMDVVLFPHAMEAVQALHAEGYRMAIVTSATQDGTEAFLHERGLAAFFDSVSGVRPGIAPKPAPDLVLDALNKLGVLPGDAIMVGDMIADIESAKAAGVRCLGVTYGFNGKDELVKAGAIHIVDSLTELQPYLERLKNDQK